MTAYGVKMNAELWLSLKMLATNFASNHIYEASCCSYRSGNLFILLVTNMASTCELNHQEMGTEPNSKTWYAVTHFRKWTKS
jgi:hypothetical protein